LQEGDLEEVAGKTTAFTKVVDSLVTDLEIKLPNNFYFHNNAKNKRYHVRLAWWRLEAKLGWMYLCQCL